MTRAQAATLIERLAAAFPATRLSADSVRLFAERLERCRLEDAREGVEQVIDTCKFFPSWAELRAAMPQESATQRYERIKRERQEANG